MIRILVDHMPVSPGDCFASGHRRDSNNWTCGFQGYAVVCDPKRCPYLAEEPQGRWKEEKREERYAGYSPISETKDCYTCGGNEMCMYALNTGQETRVNCPLWRRLKIGSKTD